MMKGNAKLFAAFGAVAFLAAGAARAEERAGTPPAARDESARAAAHEKASGEAATKETKEISGRVVQASPSKLYIEHMGAVVEFNLNDTEFSGGNLRSSRDLAEGQQVRASFTIENKTSNVAKHVSLEGGAMKRSPEHGPGEHGPAMSPGERPEGAPSMPGMPPREPGTTPPPKG